MMPAWPSLPLPRLPCLMVLALAPLLLGAAVVHGIELSLATDGALRTVVARYASGDPAVDADVVVTAPGDEAPAGEGRDGDPAWQTGRTDPEGRFTFTADRPGLWRVSVDDGQGHRAVLSFTVAPAESAEDSASDGGAVSVDVDDRSDPHTHEANAGATAGEPDVPTRFWQLVAGVSLIGALTGVAYGVAARR